MQELITGYSLVAAISAIVVYALAFVAFAIDLAQRVSTTKTAESASADRQVTGETVAAGNTSAAGKGTATAVREAAPQVPPKPGLARSARVGMALTTVGFVVNLVAVVLRGIAGGGRVPWSNMYEFALTGVTLIVGVFLLVNLWQRLAFLGTYIAGFALLALALATVNFYVGPVPLPPPLQSVWIVVHVLVAILATSFFALGAGLSVTQLMQSRREAGKTQGLRFLQTMPGSATLENLAYRLNVIGFVLWTFTLIFGAIWAERAWGRYWGWDTKEVWTFIIWVIFAGYIHARATRGWRGARSAWLAIIGFLAVLFNFTIVNLFFQGMHTYSGL